MKKRSFGLIIIFVLLISVFIYLNKKNKYLPTDDIIGVYVNNELNEKMPSKGSAMFQKAVCDDTSTKVTWDNEAWGLLISNLNKKIKCNLYFYSGQTVFDFDYTGGEQTFTSPVSGTYKVELWGAQGGNNGGNGAYTSGTIKLSRGVNVYIFVGGNGSENSAGVAQDIQGGYNGGGLTKGQDCCNRVFGTGGGATDVRLGNGDFADFNSLKSRIMVAAGGGGRFSDSSDGSDYKSQDDESNGGSGGGLMGINGSGYYSDYCYGLGASQTSGGKIGSSSTAVYCKSGTNSGYTDPDLVTGTFGIGGSHGIQGDNGTGGGGGYYGGSASGHIASAGGGSSFISGHNGCDAIKEESTENNIIHTGQSIHYSNLYFTNTLMIDGEGYRWTDKKEEQIGMPSHSDNSVIMGNSGNGYARITLVSIDE